MAAIWAARPLLPFLDGATAAERLAVATLLGTFAVARSPSSAIAVIRECKARGPFTEMVLGATVIIDVLVVIAFAAVVSLCQAVVIPDGQMEFELIGTVLVELGGAILGGVVLGWIVSLYIRYVEADLVISGRVLPIWASARSFSSVVQALEYELTLALELHVTKADGSEVAIDPRATRETERYLASADVEALHKNRQEALRQAAALLAGRVYDALYETLVR